MKKILLTLCGLVAGASLVQAQGFINMNNLSAAIKTNTTAYATGYPSVVGGTSGNTYASSIGLTYFYAVLAATSTSANDVGNPDGSDWFVVNTASDVTAASANNGPSAGSAINASGASGFATGNLAAQTVYDVMVVGWSSNIGANWAAVSGFFANNFATYAGTPGYAGYSNVGTVDPTTATPGASIFGGSAAQNGETILYAVGATPEPTTLALAGLGGLSMLFLRRRKS